MPVRFFASSLSESNSRELETLSPENPFATAAYAKASELLGGQLWILGNGEDRLIAGCLAVLRRGRLNSVLQIPSFPHIEDGEIFAEGLRKFCRQNNVSVLEIDTFASPPTNLPAISGEEVRTARQEFSFSLHNDLNAGLSTNHKRNIKKAAQAGVEIRITTEPAACVEHVHLIDDSMDRRNQRGEGIELDDKDNQVKTARALISTGAGFLGQAVLGGQVLSSILILRASRGAYYHTAGTSPEGMEKGTSQFLIHQMLERMKSESCAVFHLGGAPAGTGLERFKMGFGAKPTALERATIYVGSPMRKHLSNFVEKLRTARRAAT